MDKLNKQLEQSADEFVKHYSDASDEDISKIVAGMVALIQGNESAYENMKNQKWFERIWYGLTQKNKATIKEMRANREQLERYTVRILVKLCDMNNAHEKCIFDIYRALAVVRRDLDVFVDEVSRIAHKFDEKINSINEYVYLINEIRNGKFDAQTPLISLIDILSLVDARTAKDSKRITQLKETMEEKGFDFSKKISMGAYAEEVLKLDEDKVGRILLFCQSFSHRSRILSYTCMLMEGYFYRWDSEKRIIRENGEAIDTALSCSKLTKDTTCVLGEMFSDLKEAMHEQFNYANVIEAVNEPLPPVGYYRTKTNEPLCVIATGITGSGKSTLINSVFGWNVAATGCGRAITQNTNRYSDEQNDVVIYETPGFQLQSDINNKIMEDINSVINSNMSCVIWYCVNALSGRYEDEVTDKLAALNRPMLIVITHSIEDDDQLENAIKDSNKKRGLGNIPVISVLAADYNSKDLTISAYGLEELIDETMNIMS
jgi:GTP-binding protein EngB required for normal cell division